MDAKTALDLPRLRVRERNLPARILVVDDDELELSLMSDRLSAVGFGVTTACDGAEALRRLEDEWYPIILADWQMPVMDGIELVKHIRDHGNDDSYFIMLSVRADAADFERGYGAGVDDYLSKKSPDAELLARIEAGLNTVSLRRSLRAARAALVDREQPGENGADDNVGRFHADFSARLRAELTRAGRYRRNCSLMLLGFHGKNATPAHYDELLRAVRGLIRFDIDWADRLTTENASPRIAIVLPETGPADMAAIRHRLRMGLAQHLRLENAADSPLALSIGAASFDPQAQVPASVDEMLHVAEQCRACMAADGGGHLAAVQASVVAGANIPCRSGYAVADGCVEVASQAPVRDAVVSKEKSYS